MQGGGVSTPAKKAGRFCNSPTFEILIFSMAHHAFPAEPKNRIFFRSSDFGSQGLLQNLPAFFAWVLTPPPAPPAPAYAGFCTGKWYACVVVVRLMRCKSSPFAAFYDGKGICFAPQGATAGEENPPHPLAAAYNACRNSIVELKISLRSNRYFEQWIF